MFPKRFIYNNGLLIPKKIEKVTQNDDIIQGNENEYKIINLSRNGNLFEPPNIMPKIFLSEIKEGSNVQSQEEDEKIIYECNNINKETQTNSIFQVNNINDINYSSNELSKNLEDESNLFNKRKINLINNPKKATLYWQIEQICKHLYLSQSNDNKENIFSEMYQKENEFVKNFNKMYLNNEDLMLKRKYSVRNFSRLSKDNLSNKNNSFKHYKVKINKSYKSNKKGGEEIINKYYSEEKKKSIDNIKRTKYSYENYGINSYKYKHPQIYKLKILDKEKMKLPIIKKINKIPVELAKVIPVKKGINKEEQVNEYKFYKVMKNNRLNKFNV